MKKINSRALRGPGLWSILAGTLALALFTTGIAQAQPESDEPAAAPGAETEASGASDPALDAEPADAAETSDAEPSAEPDPEPEADPEPEPESVASDDGAETAEASASASLSLGGSSADASADANGADVDGESDDDEDAAPSDDADRGFPAFGLERLPPSAFPTHPVRGIPGGSLMWTMNGLQWPRMPMRDGSPAVRIGFSGYGFVDSAYRAVETGLGTEPNTNEVRQQGRFVLRTTPVYNIDQDWFVQGQIEYVANGDQTRTETYVDIDDAWIRVGMWDKFDVQVGRMQGWEVYHFGMGLDWATFEREGANSTSNTAEQAYVVTDMWDRSLSTGSLAAHYYPTEWARLELQSRYGTSGTGTDVGVRPVAILDFGFAKLKVCGERRTQPSIREDTDAAIETQGYGAAAMGVIYPYLEFGGGFGVRVRDKFDQDGGRDALGSDDTLSYGGFLNARIIENLLVGGGLLNTELENLNVDVNGDPDRRTHLQFYGALQYVLWDSLYIKYVFSRAEAFFHRRDEGGGSADFTNVSNSHRLRFQLFY